MQAQAHNKLVDSEKYIYPYQDIDPDSHTTLINSQIANLLMQLTLDIIIHIKQEL